MNKANMAVHPTGNGADTKVATSGQGTYCDRDASPISTGQAQQKRYSTASNGGNPSGEIVTGKDAQPRTMRGMDTHNKSDGIESVPASAGVYDQTDCACPEPISTNGLRLMAAATRANRARLAMYQMEQEAK